MSLPTNTFASPGVAFYAAAGESAVNWYQYPAENGEIQLVDASGTQLLRSVDGNLYYNDELLALAKDLQDIGDWSLYPALQSVELAGNSITQVANIDASGTITANVLDASSAIIATGITTGTIAASGALTAASVTAPTITVSSSLSSTGSATLAGAQLTAGLDMANNSITRVSSVGISNSGFAPYGSLTSPDGVALTWNGSSISTGAAGNAAQWANYPAVTTINANANPITNATTIGASGNITTATNVNAFAFNGTNVEATNIAAGVIGSGKFCIMTNNSITSSTTDGLTISVPSNNLVTTVTSGNITSTSTGNINNVSNNFEITADGGLNPLITPNINLNAKNGNGGQINVVADPGSIAALGGVVNITGNGGTITIPQPPPDLPISVTVGGEVNITANTGSGAGLYTATSAINLNAASINSYAGAIPPIGSLLGYNTVFGNLGVSICAGLPPSGIQYPATCFVYGLGIPGVAGGVRIQSPQGIQMLSDTYIENLYPLDGNGLNIQGRSLPTGYVNITDVATLTMNPATALQTDRITSVAGFGILFQDDIQATTLEPPTATAAGTPNLTSKGKTGLIPGS